MVDIDLPIPLLLAQIDEPEDPHTGHNPIEHFPPGYIFSQLHQAPHKLLLRYIMADVEIESFHFKLGGIDAEACEYLVDGYSLFDYHFPHILVELNYLFLLAGLQLFLLPALVAVAN